MSCWILESRFTLSATPWEVNHVRGLRCYYWAEAYTGRVHNTLWDARLEQYSQRAKIGKVVRGIKPLMAYRSR